MISTEILAPVFGLVVWSLIIWVWMYATRMPAMGKAEIDPQDVRLAGSLRGKLDPQVEGIADNYNHLMEQPTIFYALCFYLALSGHADALHVQLAWGYVACRVVHSLIQNTVNIVLARFVVFTLSTILLIVMAVRETMVLLG